MNTQTIQNRYEFVLLFDVKDGNPNGDPDAGNLPRIDAETAMGLVTDVCLKRKVRNFVQVVKKNERPYDIFVKEKAILNDYIAESHEQEEVKTKEKGEKTEAARQWMCRNYYDIRTFGAVMTTGKNAGQVRGPVQMTFARSIDPVVALEHAITRMAVTDKKDESPTGDNRTMGRKYTVPYGLYRAHGFISPFLAGQTGFSEDDLELFWQALAGMFEYDRSASRGEMNTQALIVFKHDSALGNAPANRLFDAVRVVANEREEGMPPRSYADYRVEIDEENIPEGVTVVKRVF